jgi:hypothetical protein
LNSLIFLGETRAAMSDGSSSGDDVSINEGTLQVASAASSFLHKSLFPSNTIKLAYSSSQVYRRISGIFRHYFLIFFTTSVSLTILRVPNLSLLLILASIHLGYACVLFQFCSGLPS